MKEKLIKNNLIKEILESYKIIWSLNHLASLAHWDLATHMPDKGSSGRGEALSKVASLGQELFLRKEFVDLIEKASKEKDLNDYEKAIIRLLKRELEHYKKLPKEFVEEMTKSESAAQIVWQKAKKADDFSMFEPHLQKIIDLSRKKAEYLGYEDHPYDALLDEFEEGLTTKDVEKFFSSIKENLIELLDYIKKSPNFKNEHPLEHEKYDVDAMRKLIDKIIDYLHNTRENLIVDQTEHPFSISISPGDQRITTNFVCESFNFPFTSTIHEYGHALYDLQSHEDISYSPIEGGTSLVIHESQSRFWENIIGRSKEFIELFYKDIYGLGIPDKHTLEDIYEYLNIVRPSLIRTEADEVTYHFHIMIRFEIEKEIMEGKINAKDIQKIWKEKYKEYLGIEPKDDKTGSLQDVHWSQGSIGYFPTYSLGTALSIMWKNTIEKDLGSVTELVKTREGIEKIKHWLHEKIHQYGSTFTFKEIVKRVCEEDFSAKYLINYLEKKYKTLY